MDNKRLKHLREKAGLTQSELASAFGFSNQRYNYYENGKNEPDNDTLIKIADYFNVSTDYLLGISSNSHPYFNKNYSFEGEELIERTYREDTKKHEVKKTIHPYYQLSVDERTQYNAESLLEFFSLLDEANQHLTLSWVISLLGKQDAQKQDTKNPATSENDANDSE